MSVFIYFFYIYVWQPMVARATHLLYYYNIGPYSLQKWHNMVGD